MRRLAKAPSAGSTTRRAKSPGRNRIALACVLALLACAGIGASSAAAAAPMIIEQLPLSATQDSATLGAKVNPNGKATTYYFEFGPGTSFSTRIPADHELFVGEGSSPIAVSISPSGLPQGTSFSFRIVATNSDGTSTGSPQPFQTLNECGFIQSRCLELVSPPHKGSSAEGAVSVNFGGEAWSRGSADGAAFAYTIGYGLPDATSGGEVFYRADRNPLEGGWLSTQLTPLSFERSQNPGEFNTTTRHKFVSRDLDCAFMVNAQNLTGEPVAQAVADAGKYNLYRRDASGAYALVTNLTPSNPSAESNEAANTLRLYGAADDCSSAVFRARYRFPGVPYTEASIGSTGEDAALYEWRDGQLRSPTVVPGPEGPEVVAEAFAGRGDGGYQNVVSEDGRTFFFTAVRKVAALPAELGKEAIYVSIDGETGIDASRSRTAVPNDSSVAYQIASEDGSNVFFLARYGLTSETSGGFSTCAVSSTPNGRGCDLYRYTVATDTLTNVSADVGEANLEGASVPGALATNRDGTVVYFAARGQLVPGEGGTEAENKAAPGAFNVYRWEQGEDLDFVANLKATDFTNGLLASAHNSATGGKWSSATTSDGNHLIFESATDITSYESGGRMQGYVYSVEEGGVACISCRRDGLSPAAPAVLFPPLVLKPHISANVPAGDISRIPPVLSENGKTAFFVSVDALAAGAKEGLNNLYEWHDGQVTLLSSEPSEGINFTAYLLLLSSTPSGDSVFFRTKESLLPQDTDGRMDVYVARAGGGFPYAPPPDSCDPLAESCSSAPNGPEPNPRIAASTTATGSNVAEPPSRTCPKGKLRRGGRCLSKRQIARRNCAKRSGKAKRRCVNKQVRRLIRATRNHRRAAK